MAVVAAACTGGGGGETSKSSTPPVPAEFKFSTWGEPGIFKDGFTQMKEAFPQYKNVDFVNSPVDDDVTLLQRLMGDWTAQSWDTMPDVVEMTAWAIPQLADAEVLVDLTELVEPFKDNIAPAVLAGVTRNGRIYGLPWTPNTGMIWYRQDVFDMAGVNADDIETWDDYIQAGKTITNFDYPDGVHRYMHSVGASELDVAMPLQLMLGEQGAGLFDPNTGEVTIDSDPAFKRAVETLVRFKQEGILLPINEWAAPWYAALNDGTLASYISANWMEQIIELDLADSQAEWRAMPLPAFEPGGTRGAFEGCCSTLVVLNKPDVNVDLAWAFMSHSFLNDQVTADLMSKWVLTPAYLPALEQQAAASPSAGGQPPFGGQDVATLDLSIQKEAKAFPYTPAYNEAMDLITAQLEAAMNGDKTVDQAISDAADAIRNDIGTSK
jgi:ABC-type glycerol-3-phosphate transport system substrate-binding protein